MGAAQVDVALGDGGHAQLVEGPAEEGGKGAGEHHVAVAHGAAHRHAHLRGKQRGNRETLRENVQENDDQSSTRAVVVAVTCYARPDLYRLVCT